ncbi:homocysteine S-methyltransferase family protein [Leucobacter luti]|uniref:Homocysteine S-methyltransferase n=1 Tax=Leucobacter luti TaxID=340320 RepID=A0A4Q7U4C1_9MICO|nr:homocysteine S-methyltransferase family protein [Leucobacter luti]MBL3700602.1 homocysteine methyltransferase [Leucobacter luti]RZT68561.1 homocysteine S-methyltransferase [Leucobacter luti]
MTTQAQTHHDTTETAPVTLTDGGIETALGDRLGQELPEFAAFVLLDTPAGRDALREYYRPFVELAAERGLPLVLDTPTWRANPDWGARVGADAAALARANADAVALVRETGDDQFPDLVVNGCVGPRYDEYVAAERMTAAEAEQYHAPQVAALAEAGADRVTAVTMLDAAEGIGVVRAAQAARIPVAVSFAVGADGLLGDGSTVAAAIAATDAATDGAAVGFLVNCAHPSEVARGLAADAGSAELTRIIGFRLNAAEHGDEGAGDAPGAFAAGELALRSYAPNAAAFGGCCGTDAPHIAALADAAA